MKLFGRNVKKETLPQKEKQLEEGLRTKLKLNKAEEEMLKYFGLPEDFTSEDLRKACEERKDQNYDDYFTTDEKANVIDKKLIDNKEIAELYLYKKQKIDETMSLYFTQCDLNKCDYGVEEKIFTDYDLDLNKLLSADKFVRFELEELSEKIQKAKTKEEIDKISNEFSLNVNTLLINISQNKLDTLEEYVNNKIKHEKAEQDFKDNTEHFEETLERLSNRTHEDYMQENKDVLIADFRSLIEKEEFLKRGTKLYYEAINNMKEMEQIDDYNLLLKTYRKAIKKIQDNITDPNFTETGFPYSESDDIEEVPEDDPKHKTM